MVATGFKLYSYSQVFVSVICLQLVEFNLPNCQYLIGVLILIQHFQNIYIYQIDNFASMDDISQQKDEFESILSIYGDDCQIDQSQNTVTVFVPNREARGKLTLQIYIPADYPSLSGPVFEVEGWRLSESLVAWAAKEMDKFYEPGNPCLFSAIEWLTEQQDLWALPDSNQNHIPQDEGVEEDVVINLGREQELSAVAQVALALQDDELQLMHEVSKKIVHGEPFTERKSTFQAHCLHVKCIEEVEAMMKVLLQNNKIRHATHNIMSYRIYNPVTNAYIQDYDDDGESAAGGRLLHMLQAANVRDVVVVVSRWFGG
eukprot:TRINITY_DN6080_c0_g1_i2.p1 TRINITY_DN6080_c0_g1~~TRINITY_DN6080_c0_g1_i2.p1  ORF type:complete len:328 (-),score=43.07 TRINITY_DN6080_c0_g1_i2:481-1428(-)